MPLLSIRVIYSIGRNTAKGFKDIACALKPEYLTMSAEKIREKELQLTRDCKDWQRLLDYIDGTPTATVTTTTTVTTATKQTIIKEPEIRIVAMRNDEFDNCRWYDGTYKSVQKKYFLDKLLNEDDGKYFVYERGITSEKNSLLLFSFKNEIIASAIFLGMKPKDDESKALIIDKTSVKVFEGISVAELKEIIPEFNGFGRNRPDFSIIYLPEVENLIKVKQAEKLIISEIDKINDDKNIDDTEKLSLMKSRRGQGLFRDKILRKFESKCIITKIDNDKLLIASHIKPWAVCSNKERLSKENGLLLTPTFDRLFDKGFIALTPTFDRLFDKGFIAFLDNGEIMLSTSLSTENFDMLNISARTKYNLRITDEMKLYLAYHREKIFIK